MRKHYFLLCMTFFLSSLQLSAQSFRKEIDAKPELRQAIILLIPHRRDVLLRLLQAMFLCIFHTMADTVRVI